MAMLAMAFPIPAGKTEQWKKFVSELMGPRKAEFAASRRSLGVRPGDIGDTSPPQQEGACLGRSVTWWTSAHDSSPG